MCPSLPNGHCAAACLLLLLLPSSRIHRRRALSATVGRPAATGAIMSPDNRSRCGFRVGYMSDVEGHWDCFLECVRRSNVLDWEDADFAPAVEVERGIRFRRLALRPDAHFVYGGDAVDKGPGDIRLARALVSLKRRHPRRVHLLVGNRDLNKLRLRSELADSDMARPIDDIGRPFWDPGAKSLREYLEGLPDGRGRESGVGGVEGLNTRAERLRYMLKHTLGCPDTFEFRREEVRLLTRMRIYGEYPPSPETHDVTPVAKPGGGEATSVEVTDAQVVDSFLYEIGPGGSLRQYLNLSSIAAILGNTIFVHGAIDSMTMKFVPSLNTKFQVPTSPPPPFDGLYTTAPTDGRIVENVHEWVRSLNDYLRRGLQDFDDRPEWNEDRTSRGGEALLAIQNRPSVWGRSVVCNSYADGGVIATADALEERTRALRAAREKLDPLAFEGIASDVMDPAPARWLLEHGIQRLVVGHKPTGDCPAVLSPRYTGVEIVSVDTSYARRGDPDDAGATRFGRGRGRAVAMVEIAGRDASSNRLETFGALACGTEYSNEFPTLGGGVDADESPRGGDPFLGRRTLDGWWVKASTPPTYHLCRGSGRFVEYDVRPMQDVVNELEP